MNTIFKGLRGCMALIHTPMLRRCIIAGTKERFEGLTPPQHPQHYIRLLGGLSPINLTRRNKAQCLVCGVTGALPLSAAMFVTVFYSLPEHKPLFRLNHEVSPESSCLEQDNSCIVPRQRHRDKRENKINGKHTSIPYVGMLFV